MKVVKSTRRIMEPFSPVEAEMITGVSRDLQRDWKRRGLLAATPGKHAKWTLSDLGDMLILGELSRAGLSPKLLRDAASMASLSISSRATGLTLKPEYLDDPETYRGFLGERFLVATGGMTKTLSFVRDLRECGRLITRAGSPVVVIFDCLQAALHIVAKSPRPVVTEEVLYCEGEAD